MYRQLMDAFIQDDHEHTVCAVSASVQLYTVPTLVRVSMVGLIDVLCVCLCVAL